MKLTRRKLAGLLTSAAGVALASEQTPQVPATPEAELQAAKDRVKARGELLAKQTVPMSLEPAFQFKP